MPSRPRTPRRQLPTSPFSREEYVPPSTAEFHVGDRVTHDRLGMGRVIEVTDDYVLVDFGVGCRGRVPAGAKGLSRL